MTGPQRWINGHGYADDNAMRAGGVPAALGLCSPASGCVEWSRLRCYRRHL